MMITTLANATLRMDVGRRWSNTSRAQVLVACNVYVSAGRCHHADLLLKVLNAAQSQCSHLRSESNEKIALVHAFADGPYDRSSFHLAGRPQHVAAVATEIAKNSIDGLLLLTPDESMEKSRHPFVGLVDHIAVMPLFDGESGNDLSNNTLSKNTPNGQAATFIGNQLRDAGVQVLLYGNAHPDGTPLADVRRYRTNFFLSGGLDTRGEGELRDPKGVATVGAPPTFVENFNIRLTANCDRSMARSLTKMLRERDGGLLGVEGLTLPYSNNRTEIACNLLRPDVGSADAITERAHQWALEQVESSSFEGTEDLIETGYRVGTTAEQCLQVLSLSSAELKIHDVQVKTRLTGFLGLL